MSTRGRSGGARGGPAAPPLPTETQVSAGGVAYRARDARIEIVLVAVGEARRWQLPKGLIDADETPDVAARREVREEGGVETTLVAPIETIEYWYVGERGRGTGRARVRFHKFVHFFLLAHAGGEVDDHDDEVAEARWVAIDEAPAMLAFASERRVVERARAMLEERAAV
jgi:8-oxo-dGTP pyrophosphatase MutT (NUDIX family)